MTDDHPITLPHVLIDKWSREAFFADDPYLGYVRAAQWGADQELEACCEWAQGYAECGDSLLLARRPKPPSLKEQALKALQFVDEKLDLPLHNHCNAIHTIRTALEALRND